LVALVAIVTPEPVSWAPQTVGWYLLALILLLGLVWAAVRAVRRYRADRYRREALTHLRELGGMVTAPDPVARVSALHALPEIVRRVALSASSDRAAVASPTGIEWMEVLDESYGGKGFTQGPGRPLADIGYLPDHALEAMEPATASGLIAEVERWIRSHRGPPHA
jgi:hypothetical protein